MGEEFLKCDAGGCGHVEVVGRITAKHAKVAISNEGDPNG